MLFTPDHNLYFTLIRPQPYKVQTMSFTNPQSISKLNVIASHILQVIHQLSMTVGSEADNNEDNQTAPSILLVSDNKINEQLSQLLSQSNPKLVIDSLSLAEFQDAPFNRRYTLGCLIQPFDPDLVLASHETQTQPTLASYNPVAIRLRDLFAEQSLLLTHEPSSKLNFTSLGYIPLTIETADEMPNLISWQFNLYDYKQRPDWLNAKYWANPENFDKYRW